MATYPMHVAGLDRDFPICKVTDDLYIGAFIMFGDAELTVRCAEELLKLAEGIDYDYLFTAEAKSIPLIHEMARQSGAYWYRFGICCVCLLFAALLELWLVPQFLLLAAP